MPESWSAASGEIAVSSGAKSAGLLCELATRARPSGVPLARLLLGRSQGLGTAGMRGQCIRTKADNARGGWDTATGRVNMGSGHHVRPQEAAAHSPAREEPSQAYSFIADDRGCAGLLCSTSPRAYRRHSRQATDAANASHWQRTPKTRRAGNCLRLRISPAPRSNDTRGETCPTNSSQHFSESPPQLAANEQPQRILPATNASYMPRPQSP